SPRCPEWPPVRQSTAASTSLWPPEPTAGSSCGRRSTVTTSPRFPIASRSSRRFTCRLSGRPVWKKRERSSEGAMNWKKVFAVIRREYTERIRTKAFWIGTALIPIFFFAYIAIQIATSKRAGGERRIAVLDGTGSLYEPLVADLAEREK